METKRHTKDSHKRLRTELRRKEERILYLERMQFGSKRDKAPKAAAPREPTFFGELFDKVYDYFEKQDGVVMLCCLAHIRRKFVEAELACPGVAKKALEYISLLYTMQFITNQ